MQKEIRAGFLLTRDGKPRWGMILAVVFALVLFLSWRISTQSVFGSDRILQSIREEIVGDYRQKVLKSTGYYGEELARKQQALDAEAAAGSDLDFDALYHGEEEDEEAPAGGDPYWQQMRDLDVEFSNVSMSAPLFSWSTKEDVVVRFDYTVRAGGTVREEGRNRYIWVERKRGMTLWPSGPIRYYMNYF